MNGDGNLDLIVAEYGGTGTGDVGIFLGDGMGHFKQFGAYQAGIEPISLAVADFNGDGNLDVAVANTGNDGSGESMMVFPGDGTGRLGQPDTYRLQGGRSGGPTAIATGDLDGDGHPDLAVAVVDRRKDHLPYVAVMLNDGTGKFKLSGQYFAGGGGPTSVAIADLNGDGRPDIAIGNENQSLGILLNKGGGKFGKTAVYPSCHQCGGPNVIAVADFNLDGIPDIVCTGNFSQPGSNGIFYGLGSGKFASEVTIPKVLGGAWLTSAKFGRDDAPDLAITNGNKVAVLINKK
jgi:hypothetical protein